MNQPIPFLSPRMVGGRFNEHTVPLEILKDLAALEEMIIEVAKWHYLQDHAERKRTPHGFTDGISLNLTAIEQGSAILHICLFTISMGFLLHENHIYLEKARDSIINAISAAEHKELITIYLPEKLLSYFDRIGRSLRDGEEIEFAPQNTNRPACLTKTTRRALILASSQDEVTEEVSLRGSIPEANQGKMTFELQIINGPRVIAPIAVHYRSTVLEAFNGYCEGTRVLLRGVGCYNRVNRLQSIETVEHLSLLDSRDIAARLDELRTLKNGWLDGKGMAPPSDGFDWLTSVFESNYPDTLPLPYLYPTAEGGIQAEWSLCGYEIGLEIALGNHHGEWNALNMGTEEATERSLNFDRPEDWQWLAAQIKTLAEAA